MVDSCTVTDKISPIFVCKHVQGTETSKANRTGEKYLATEEINPELVEAVLKGAKVKATAKLDGTCCRIIDGLIQKRRDIKADRSVPDDWIQTGAGSSGGHLIGYMPIDKNDKWHLDCYSKKDGLIDTSKVRCLKASNNRLEIVEVDTTSLNDRSVEVIGEKFQANPHKIKGHCVVEHGLIELKDFPDVVSYIRTEKSGLFDDIKDWFNSEQGAFVEGVVLHLDNGSMYKLHLHHLNLTWTPSTVSPLIELKL